MARISGVDLPREKRVEIGLTYIFGIGLKTSQDILAATVASVTARACRSAVRTPSRTPVPVRVRRRPSLARRRPAANLRRD